MWKRPSELPRSSAEARRAAVLQQERVRAYDHICDAGEIFVFGSNLAGIHGAGAAWDAYSSYGAENGVGEGLTGWAYALPTKDKDIQTRPLNDIACSVSRFIEYASSRPELKFFVTKVGCGLAGFTEEEIAPLFRHAPANCRLPLGWRVSTTGDASCSR